MLPKAFINILKNILLLVAITSLTKTALAEPSQCENLFVKTQHHLSEINNNSSKTANKKQSLNPTNYSASQSISEVKKNISLGLKIYTKDINPSKNPNGFAQIGYESEYLFEESALILKDYAPDNKVFSTKKWDSLSDQERIQWIKNNFQNKPEFATKSGLKKRIKNDFMPDELIVDSTGNIEIVLPPFDTYKQWENAVDFIVARYGVGSQQAMVSKDRASAYGAKPTIAEHLGWFVYSNLKDMFIKLKSGYERYKKDNTKLTALSFDHPFLGPMNKIKRDVFEHYLAENAFFRKYDEDSKAFVRKNDASFKYTGGPSYRPDVAGPNRYAWEIRNAHKDVDDLKNKVKRDLVAHAIGLEPYIEFSKVPAFDNEKTFDNLPATVQTELKKLFPSKADPRFEYTANEHRVLEMYRNFALPFSNYKPLAQALGSSPLQVKNLNRKISEAQKLYLSRLVKICEQASLGQISSKDAKAQIMGALGEFADTSGIAIAFEQKAKSIGHE